VIIECDPCRSFWDSDYHSIAVGDKCPNARDGHKVTEYQPDPLGNWNQAGEVRGGQNLDQSVPVVEKKESK
jgi:hypothetical protein